MGGGAELSPTLLLTVPQIVAVRVKDDSSRDTIAVVLSQDAVCLGPDGQPWSGVSLTAQLARSLAARLLALANEIEDQEPQENQSSFRSLVHVSSILVFHDGSGQSHRAFALALDFASRSLASIQLVGVYGVHQERFEPSTAVEDIAWQKGWLEKLVKMYSLEACKSGIALRTRLIAASEEQTLSDVFNDSDFDLIVMPRRFSDDKSAGESSRMFHQSLAGASDSTILFCP